VKRINVIGTTGSGKSTFSKALAEKLDCKYIQMDALFWKPNWGETPDEAFFTKIKQATSVEIDYSYFRTLFQLLSRTINRAWTKQELWEGTGNISTFKKSFLSKDSIIIWFFKCYKKNKIRYAKLIESQELEGVTYIRLQSRKEAAEFLQHLDYKEGKQEQ